MAHPWVLEGDADKIAYWLFDIDLQVPAPATLPGRPLSREESI